MTRGLRGFVEGVHREVAGAARDSSSRKIFLFFVLIIPQIISLTLGDSVFLLLDLIFWVPKLTPIEYQHSYFALGYAAAAYLSEDDIINPTMKCHNTSGQFMEDLRIVNDDSNLAFATINAQRKAIVVAFRGTDNLLNVKQDVKFKLVKFPYTKDKFNVHRGFLEAYEGVRTEIKANFDALLESYPDYTIYITGHSLGGAMAHLFLYEVSSEMKKRNAFLITFGSPKVGDSAVLNLEKHATILRFAERGDLVPEMPPLSDFVHVGNKNFFFRKSYYSCTNVSKHPTCQPDLVKFREAIDSHRSALGITNAFDCNK